MAILGHNDQELVVPCEKFLSLYKSNDPDYGAWDAVWRLTLVCKRGSDFYDPMVPLFQAEVARLDSHNVLEILNGLGYPATAVTLRPQSSGLVYLTACMPRTPARPVVLSTETGYRVRRITPHHFGVRGDKPEGQEHIASSHLMAASMWADYVLRRELHGPESFPVQIEVTNTRNGEVQRFSIPIGNGFIRLAGRGGNYDTIHVVAAVRPVRMA
jgi:hypothetical protein